MSTTSSPTTTPGPAPLRRNGSFALLWLGEGVSVLGAMTTTVVVPLLAVTEFGAGAGWMGLLTAAAWLPWLVVGLPAGAWVDRLDPRRVMVVADLVAALAVGSVPAAFLLGVLGLPHLLAAALLSGACSVFFRTAYGAFVPRVVREEDLDTANGRLYGTESAMQVAGPGVGGLLVQLVGAALAVVADVVSFLVSAACLWRIDPRTLRPAPERPARGRLRDEIADGVRIVRRDPFLRFFSLQGAASNFALTGYGALLVLFLVRDLDVAPATVGLLVSAGSVGGLVGAAVASPLARRVGTARAMRWLQVLGGPTALLVPLAGPGARVALVPLGVALVGVGVVGANVVRSAFRQRYTPAHLLGRTMSASSVLNFGTMPLAGLAAGWLGTGLGVQPTILVMTALHAVVSLSPYVGPYRRGRDLPAGRLVEG
ncbi:MFS transporter [Phycicoccus sonneratiae]|uniref:MFS transporter n=1 Tax=Phycicoccus sonneratiae TaxID=2807628 RepID=A0ABS2CIC2_9MICO|nr:MFS transporter [Phycicoccus sonneraticus]MBM6399540.1 MFS transporter [Phycicoccus sonneraticus]